MPTTVPLTLDLWNIIICHLGPEDVVALSKADLPFLRDIFRSMPIPCTLPLELWKRIMDYLGPEDIASLSNADLPFLRDIFRSMPSPCALPLELWKRIIGYLGPEDVASLSNADLPFLRDIFRSISSKFSLPIELWEKVIGHLPPKDLVSLLHTGIPVLSDISRSELYWEMSFWDTYDFYFTFAGFHMHNEPFSEDVHKERTRTSHYSFHSALEWTQAPILCNMSRFWNLRSLSLSRVIIDSQAVLTLQTLPRLECLMLSDCTVDPALTNATVQIDQDNELSKRKLDVTIWGPKSVHPFISLTSADEWVAVLPPKLGALTIRDVNVEFSGSLLFGFISSCRIELLETFDCGSCPVLPSWILVPFLESTLRLRKFIIYDGYDADSAPPVTAIPLLEEFEGPARLCELFVTGRPVHTVTLTLTGENIPRDILQSLERSATPVRNLELQFYMLCFISPGPMGDFMRHAPTSIQHFAWDRVGNDSFESFVDVIGRFPNLRTLQGILAEDGEDVSVLYWKEYEEFVKRCTTASVSLQEITFIVQESGSVHGRWVRRKDDTWEYYSVIEYKYD